MKINSYIIESERLYCRPFTMDDLDGFHGLNGSEEVMKFIRPVISWEQSREKLKNTIEEYLTKPELLRYALVEKNSHEFVGCFVIFPLENSDDTQLGYSLLPPYWGKGYASEMTGAGLQYIFTVLKLEKIFGVTRKDHIASQRVLIKNGFGLEKQYRENEEELYLFKKENPAST
jgi:RimJ/RimL family protein N-acetyltransferase